MLSRRRFLGGAAGAWLVLPPAGAGAQEGSFMQAEEAPRQLFPEASEITERTIPTTPDLQQRVRALLSRPPTLWETAYRVFTAKQGASLVGFVIVVEEIGKHRPITYAIAVKPDGTVQDAAVLAYREAYGGQVRERRFLRQYVGKGLGDSLRAYQDIRNIAGATLSVEATGRAMKKAIAVLKALGDIK